MNAEPVIQTNGLTKSYGKHEAVRNLSLTVGANRITGFLGRNGAGKSTTIKMLLGLIRPTDGGGTVLGHRISDHERNPEMRQRIAYVAEDKPLYRYMSVEQMMRFMASLYRDWRPDVAARLLREFELPPDRKVKHLSKGMRTKLSLLLAFARKPDLLMLDEPSEGLDPVMIENLLQATVAQSAEGTAVFFSSHQIAEVERIADHVCILERGSLLLDKPLDQLRESYRRIDLVLPYDALDRDCSIDFSIPGVERIRTSGRQLRVFASRNSEAVVARASELCAVSVQVSPVELREIFLETVKEN